MSTAPRLAPRALALVLAASLATSACAHKQLTNRQVAAGAFTVLVVVGLVVALSFQCNELTESCE
jgi:hypothetical protein